MRKNACDLCAKHLQLWKRTRFVSFLCVLNAYFIATRKNTFFLLRFMVVFKEIGNYYIMKSSTIKAQNLANISNLGID